MEGQWSKMVVLSALLSVVLFTGCKTRITAEKPKESYLEKRSYNKLPSVINVPVEIPVNDLEVLVNKNINGVIYEDQSYADNDGDNLKYVIKKYAPFEFYAKGNNLFVSMPLDVSGSYKKLGAVIGFKGTLEARYLTTINLLDNWEIETKTESYGYEWIKKPEIDLGWIDVPVQWIVNKILDKQEDKVDAYIDELIEEYVDLEEIVQPAFQALSTPINISEAYDSWFTMEPIKAFSTPLTFQNESLIMTFGIEAYTETFVGEPSAPDSVEVVPLSISEQLDEGFNLQLVTIMPFDKASVVLDNEFVKSGYVYEEGKYRVSFTKMEIFGQRDKLVIEAGLDGSVRGDIYLIGDPYYDPIDRVIKLKNLDYHFKSKQALLKSADWLAHGQLCKLMEKNMYFEIGKELDAAKLEAQEYLRDYQPVEGVSINGTIDQLETSDVYLVKNAMILVITADGGLSVKVQGLE